MTDTRKIHAQAKPTANVAVNLYTVPVDSQAKGTIYISQQQGIHDTDYVSVQLIPSTLKNGSPVSSPYPESNTFIMSNTMFYGQVSIYLQQICLNTGDSIKVKSNRGYCAFTYIGDLYTP